MPPVITAFAQAPDGGRGLVRDMRVRWALEEVGQPYEARLLSHAEMKAPAHLARSPFGQIPTFEDGDTVLFESGAIVLHIATQHPGLLPQDAHARARAISWLFAVLNSVEPVIADLATTRLFEGDQPWAAARLPLVEQRARARLGELAQALGRAEWLDGDFSAGDLLMVTVLRRLNGQPLLAEHPTLAAYFARGEARPAFQRAFAAQLAVFERGAS